MAFALAACTPSKQPVANVTVTSTVTHTRTPPPQTYVPPPPSFAPPLAEGAAPPAGEVDRLCPYIRTGLNMDPTSEPNVADIIGSRIYRTTVLTALKPVGCRFYFYVDFSPEADILPTTFPNATDAHNAMVLTADKTGTNQATYTVASGIPGIVYQTKFVTGDDGTDWACVFAKGAVMVVVHSHTTNTSNSVLSLAQAIVGKF
jgi:hypothetical protein